MTRATCDRHIGVVVCLARPRPLFSATPLSVLALPGRSPARFVPYAGRRRAHKFVRLSGGHPYNPHS